MKSFLMDIYNKIKILRNECVRVGKGCNIAGSSFKGYNSISQNTRFLFSELGLCSYIGENCLFSYAQIGKFCSIGSNVSMAIGNHPTKEWVSTHPAFFSTLKQSGIAFTKEQLYDEKIYAKNNYYISIGNDVWIGNNVVLLPGITISDGAIIAAGSVVTKNVEPFAIIGGNPAKLIRYRFNEQERAYLQILKWWDKDMNWIKKHAQYFRDINNLKTFIDENNNNSK